MSEYKLHLGNCLDHLEFMPDNSVDSIVTDPPYGLSFMGKKWDYDVPSVEIWAECLRVLKPGGHLLSFAGTRTQHRMAVNIEDAGFEIRDMVSILYDTNKTAQALIESLSPEQLKLLDATFGRDGMLAWTYGSGFPKSMNVADAIEKHEAKKIVRTEDEDGGVLESNIPTPDPLPVFDPCGEVPIPYIQRTRKAEGFGTALKPALEPITVARKPFKGTVAANLLAHGTGALNIDGCRIPTDDKLGGGRLNGPTSMASTCGGDEWDRPWMNDKSMRDEYATRTAEKVAAAEDLGRWPANVIHDGSDEVLAAFPANAGAAAPVKGTEESAASTGNVTGKRARVNGAFHADSGSAARFFYCAKASRKDRNEGLQDPGPQFQHGATLRKVENTDTKGNNHPTVKPTDLMAYLCRLVTPPGGIVLDPFMGSGSTGKAAMREGFGFIGMEMDPDYFEIAKTRIKHEANKNTR